MNKPCRLEFKSAGHWKLIGRFDAADDDWADDVLTAAEQLARAINGYRECDEPEQLQMRVMTCDAFPIELMTWKGEEGGMGQWVNTLTGAPA